MTLFAGGIGSRLKSRQRLTTMRINHHDAAAHAASTKCRAMSRRAYRRYAIIGRGGHALRHVSDRGPYVMAHRPALIAVILMALAEMRRGHSEATLA